MFESRCEDKAARRVVPERFPVGAPMPNQGRGEKEARIRTIPG